VFPHHENEIAQTRCAFHTPAMANFWMHNGFLQVEGRKMAKSEGNFITIRELFDGWKGKRWRRQEIRLLMLSTQYRQPLDWTLQGLEETQRVISHWEQVTAKVDYDHDVIEIKPSEPLASALLDDLNTPDAIFHLHELAKAARASRSAANELYANLVFLGIFAADRREEPDLVRKLAEQRKDLATEQKIRWIVSKLDSSSNVTETMSSTALDSVLVTHMDHWKKYGPPFISKDDVELITEKIGIEELNRRVEERLESRRSKDFAKSDRIRHELHAMGIELEDHKDGTTWKVKR
jgi:cysteinyl-tRNA synthetase